MSDADNRQGKQDGEKSIAKDSLVPMDESSSNEINDHGGDSSLQRRLFTRHAVMISIASSIGMGLWLGSGLSLTRGGPAGLFLSYCLGGSIIWAVNQSIGEMAVIYPLPSAFVQWTSRFVDPAAGFALGWAYWGSSGMLANEVAGLVTVLHYWKGVDVIPVAGYLTLFLGVFILVNVGVVSLFGNFEVVVSSIKFFWIFVVVIASIVVSAGGGPTGHKTGFHYWRTDAFPYGFKGFLAVLPTTIFAYAGSENSAMVIAELRNPRTAVPRAVRSIWIRLSLFYILGSLSVTITTNPRDPDLFGNAGTGASPFVLAFRNAGIPGLAHATNVIIFLSVLSTGAVAGYGGSRTLVGLANLGMAPKIFGRADKLGRPWAGLVLTFIVGGGLCYLNVNNSGKTVFDWLSNLSSLFTLFGWAMISLSHIRFRRAWAAQGRLPEDLPWRNSTFPWSAYWSLIWCVILIIVQFYLSVWPLGKESSAKQFFANYVSVILIVVIYLGAKAYYRGPWLLRSSTIDLDKGRRFYASRDEESKTKWWKISI